MKLGVFDDKYFIILVLNSVSTTQRTQSASNVQTNWLILFREIVDVYCKNQNT